MPKRRGSGRGDSDRVKVLTVSAWARVATTAVKWAGVTACSYWFFRCIEALAGQDTNANVLMDLAVRMGISRWLAFAVGGCGLVYGMQQRKLRRRVVERTGGRIKDLEARLDPRRSSSQLDDRGRTPPDA